MTRLSRTEFKWTRNRTHVDQLELLELFYWRYLKVQLCGSATECTAVTRAYSR